MFVESEHKKTPHNGEIERMRSICSLTDYQVASIMQFRGYSTAEKKLIPYAGLGGILAVEEIELLKHAFPAALPGQEAHKYPRDIIDHLIHQTQDASILNILKKIQNHIAVEIVTGNDIADSQAFDSLPLTSRFIVSQMKTDLFHNAKEVLKDGNVIVITRFKKPSANYLKAIEEIQGEGTIEKVSLALEDSDKEIKKVSHEFINVAVIPVNNESNHTMEIRDITNTLNRRVDKKLEEDYAKALLLKTMLTKEMKGTMYGMVSVAACMPLLHLLNEHFHDNVLAQTLINFIPPFIADLVTFWGQLSPWLEGDTFSEKSGDFAKRLLKGSHKWSFATSIITTAIGSAGAELIKDKYGFIPGSIVYGGVPFLVAAMTTHQTIRTLQEKTGKSYYQTARMMFANNPAHLGIDLGAFSTFPTAVGVLGFGGQMNNPIAKGLIEGVEEHAIASTFTMLQLFIGQTYSLNKRMEDAIDEWTKKGLISSSS